MYKLSANIFNEVNGHKGLSILLAFILYMSQTHFIQLILAKVLLLMRYCYISLCVLFLIFSSVYMSLAITLDMLASDKSKWPEGHLQ